tara:strand:- start:203 stop:892 length:690 start_codon:yes stop_codon:yes gene_type:complete
MKKIIITLLSFLFSTSVLANDIYITQSGASLNLDVVQDGANNVFGTSSTRASLIGSAMAFSVTQTGNTNIMAADVEGASASVDVDITGDSNNLVLNCNATGNYNCDNWNVDIDVTDSGSTGDSNDIDIDVGTIRNSADSDVTLQITGDTNTANIDIDGASAPVSLTVTGSTNTFNVDVDGDGDSAGHSVTMQHTGSSGNFDVIVSGTNDANLNLITSGANADVDTSQTD